jgi:recombining binding protein (suppressor of hairless)
MGFVRSRLLCELIADQWLLDAFVMYIVNVNHKTSPSDAPLAPPQPDFPSPPPNAIPFTNNGSPIPVYYNQTVVLQCLTSGVVSPVLVIRKVDHSTTAVGGGTPDHTKAAADHYCPPGEVCGDPVSQLHKIAFEVYDSNAVSPVTTGMPGESGAFLSCMGEKVNTYRPVEGRKWSPRPGDSPMLSPATPLGSSASFGSMADYFGGGGFDSMPPSPQLGYQSNDGGRVPRKKRSGGSSSNRSRTSRRRPASTDSLSPTASHFSDALALNPYHGAQWQVEIGETSVWTIVGVDQVRYNFYVPPVLLDNPHAPRGQSYPIPTNKVTPFPSVVKWLPADRAAEVVRSGHHWQPQPHTDQSKMLTLYGENFNKSAPPRVFFGADPSPFVEVRCNEVVGCLPPDAEGHVNQGPRRPIMLVREDGIVYPTTTMYP